MAERQDYSFPFRVDPASRQARRAGYEAHVAQMVRQVLLTSPGERADLPEFGCGLRALVFAPSSDALAVTTELLIRQSLRRWLAGHLEVLVVEIDPPSTTIAENELWVRVEYRLLATRATQRVEVRVA